MTTEPLQGVVLEPVGGWGEVLYLTIDEADSPAWARVRRMLHPDVSALHCDIIGASAELVPVRLINGRLRVGYEATSLYPFTEHRMNIILSTEALEPKQQERRSGSARVSA